MCGVITHNVWSAVCQFCLFYKWTNRQTVRLTDDSTGTGVAESPVCTVSCCYHQIYCTAVDVGLLHLLYAKTFLWGSKYLLTTAQLSSLECCDYVTCGCRLSFYTLHSLLLALQCRLATCKSRHFYFCFWHFILRNFVKKLQVPVSTNCGNNYHTYHCIEKYLVVWRKCEKLKKKFATMRYIHTRLWVQALLSNVL